MSKLTVSQVAVGAADDAGREITAVYAKHAPHYAVFQTSGRVLVQFSDHCDEEDGQRTAMAPLGPLRGEINGLCDDWRSGAKQKGRDTAARYDRRVSDALIVALESDAAAGKHILQTIKDDLIEERKSRARFLYLSIASGASLLVVLVACLTTSTWYASNIYDFAAEKDRLWEAAGAGALGAFFSIAQSIQKRSILTDLHMRDNASDALLRVLIGAIAGVVLVALFSTGLVNFSINGAGFGGTAGPRGGMDVLVTGFIAGFFERLVPDLLSAAAANGTRASTPPPAPRAPADAPQASSRTSGWSSMEETGDRDGEDGEEDAAIPNDPRRVTAGGGVESGSTTAAFADEPMGRGADLPTDGAIRS